MFVVCVWLGFGICLVVAWYNIVCRCWFLLWWVLLGVVVAHGLLLFGLDVLGHLVLVCCVSDCWFGVCVSSGFVCLFMFCCPMVWFAFDYRLL